MSKFPKPAWIVLLTLIVAPVSSYGADSVNVYSARKGELIRPLLEAFTAETDITVNVVSGKADALLVRIQNEGRNSPADVLLTVDAGRLARAKQAGVLAPLESETLDQLVPAHLQDVDKEWVGLSLRARPILINTEYFKNNPEIETPTRYADLASSSYTGKICIRSSSNIYNQSLVASQIAHNGEEVTGEWAQGLVNNMARKPQGGDRDQIRAAALGQCPIAVANTYYLAKMLSESSSESDRELAGQLTVISPDQEGFGTHVNVSGAGVLKTAPNKENAIRLLEYLASDSAQEIYANVNYEYPIRDDVKQNEILTGFGDFVTDQLNLTKLGELNPAAVKLMDRAGWK
ncbi:MAG: Fe(3+) ABC transporter substrate-binding protein [Pseudomonadota bacterium]